VYIVQCKGRIVTGPDANGLEVALELAARQFSRIVLNVAEVNRLDSTGLGLLVRFATNLHKRGGDLRLAAAPEFLVKLLEMTKLSGIVESYPTEEAAILSFLKQRGAPKVAVKQGPRVLVVDQSADLCSFVRAVLMQHGFDVKSASLVRDARILLQVDGAEYILVGPGTLQLPADTVAGMLKPLAPKAATLQLDADFKSRDAQEATELLLQMFGTGSTPAKA
jgi:anti-sigma B factor antagonist